MVVITSYWNLTGKLYWETLVRRCSSMQISSTPNVKHIKQLLPLTPAMEITN